MVSHTTEQEYLADLRERQRRSWPAGVPAEVSYPFGEVALTEYLRERARREPDRTMLVFYGSRFTFADIDELSDRFAAFLMAEGVGMGERVAVMLPNCPQFVMAFYGILKAGCVHVPVNPMFREAELAHELADSGATTIVCQDGLVELVEAVRPTSVLERVVVTSLAEYAPEVPTVPLHPSITDHRWRPGPGTVPWSEALRSPRPATLPAPDLDRLAALNYTGGTTGLPKGCQHTQRHMIYTAACSTSLRPPRAAGRAADVSLVFIPVFWIAGENAVVINPVFAGSTCVLLTRWDPEAVLVAIDRYRVTGMGATVENYLQLAGHPRFAEYDLSSLVAPAAMSFVTKLGSEHRRAWRSLAGEHSVLREGAYGMTETHTLDTLTAGFAEGDRDLRSRPVFCGVPMPGTEIKIVDFGSGELVPLGAEGEICIRTPSLFRGYWRRPEVTAEVIRDGWFHTGDIGMLDDDGCLHFLGRRKEMLKVNGMSVFPSELEVLLGQHPDIEGSAVVGRTDARRGEVPVAFVTVAREARGRLDAAELTAWCEQNMARYKVPEIRIVDGFPLTTTGKVKKTALAELVAATTGDIAPDDPHRRSW